MAQSRFYWDCAFERQDQVRREGNPKTKRGLVCPAMDYGERKNG